jgi:trehalose-phosphatase
MKTNTQKSDKKSAGRQIPAKAKKHKTRLRQEPQHLFSAWSKVARRLRLAKAIVLFLDFDGTLVRLRRKPKEVYLGEPARRLLRRLARHPAMTVCFISGRQLADLRRRARVEGALYFGLHGWERSNGRTASLPGAGQLREGMEWVQEQVRSLLGIRVEDKGICFGVHYRTARDSAVREARAVVKTVLERLGPGFRLMAGKKIWEIYPEEMGSKGRAAQDLLRQLPGRKLAIYAGDDTTDETAFALLKSGVTIRVGRFRETHAKFFLRSPAEVLTFLKKLEDTLA